MMPLDERLPVDQMTTRELAREVRERYLAVWDSPEPEPGVEGYIIPIEVDYARVLAAVPSTIGWNRTKFIMRREADLMLKKRLRELALGWVSDSFLSMPDGVVISTSYPMFGPKGGLRDLGSDEIRRRLADLRWLERSLAVMIEQLHRKVQDIEWWETVYNPPAPDARKQDWRPMPWGVPRKARP